MATVHAAMSFRRRSAERTSRKPGSIWHAKMDSYLAVVLDSPDRWRSTAPTTAPASCRIRRDYVDLARPEVG